MNHDKMFEQLIQDHKIKTVIGIYRNCIEALIID